MTKYYFLATVLPELTLGSPPEIGFHEFLTLLRENLTAEDYAKTVHIRWFSDINNIRAFWKGDPLDHWGNLNRNELEEELITREGRLPPYVFKFMDDYETLPERLNHFPLLFARYFEEAVKESNGFIHAYMEFERQLRLTLTAYRARQLGRDLSRELQFHDPEEEIIRQLLAQKNSPEFEPPQGFEDLKPILEKYYHSPHQLQMAILEYRFNKLEEMVDFDVFSIDHILLYMIKYIILDKWMQLDKEKGLEMVDSIVKDVL